LLPAPTDQFFSLFHPQKLIEIGMFLFIFIFYKSSKAPFFKGGLDFITLHHGIVTLPHIAPA
jgi:hypothetical protein